MLVACVAFFCAIQIFAAWRPVAPAELISPRAAIDYVRRAGITGNVFNLAGFGGFLMAEGIPTFIDGRVELYATSNLLHDYIVIKNCLDLGRALVLLDEYRIAWVILRPDTPMATALAREPIWERVFIDTGAVVFIRRNA